VIGSSFTLTWEGAAVVIAVITGAVALLVRISRSVQDIRNRVDAVGPDGTVIKDLVEGQRSILRKLDEVLHQCATANSTLAEHTKSDAENFESIDTSLTQLKLDVHTLTGRNV